jgi:uncharacterized metal-binding protein YceD (DUF177 family)
MTTAPPQQFRLRVAHLNPRSPTPFHLQPDADKRAAIAEELGITGLPKLDFKGQIRAEAGNAWTLSGRLTARVVQPCVVTLKPVKTSLDEEVRRTYSPHVTAPEAEEIEMPDDSVELLGQFIDLESVMIEALALALPEYPRAGGVEFEEENQEVPAEETRRPFEGLDKLLKSKDTDV